MGNTGCYVINTYHTYLGSLFDPSQTAKHPSSISTSPNGVHIVNNLDVPRDMYTLSTWAPV